jgi:hypothetical protein
MNAPLEQAFGRLAALARETACSPVRSAPSEDILRSPAALVVGRLASAHGLHLFNYEARVELEWPDAWLPDDRPDLGVDGLPPLWDRGVLPEPKYAAFRHDLLTGSLHPGQRAKWTAHELAHGLVGFAWDAEGSTLFHALAARLAEALPVALWYFWDEAWLHRCPRHAAARLVGPAWCPDCEVAARTPFFATTPPPHAVPDAEPGRWLSEGMDFLRREVDATLASARRGAPVFSPWGSIDLMADGLAYAGAHAHRLRSPEFQSWIARFCVPSPARAGWHSTLESLAERVLAVAEAILHGAPLVPETPRTPLGHVLTDLGLRILQVTADTDGECWQELDRLVVRLADAAQRDEVGAPEVAAEAIAETIAGWEALHAEYELPDADALFAVGTSLPAASGDTEPVRRGLGLRALRAGLETVCGRTIGLLCEAGDLTPLDADALPCEDLIADFAYESDVSRARLGRRFAAWLTQRDHPLADVARLEAAIGCAEPPDPALLTLGWDGADPDGLRLARGVELVESERDTAAIVMHGAAPDEATVGPRAWLVRRDAADQIGLTAVSAGTASAVREEFLTEDGALDAQAAYELNLLAEEGFVVPDRWSLQLPRDASAPAH